MPVLHAAWFLVLDLGDWLWRSHVLASYARSLLFSTQSVGEWTIYPWIHSNCNSHSDEDQLRPVSIPDILPAR
ncbi:Carnosine N-methyltransferase [Bienertia sinuspersici]